MISMIPKEILLRVKNSSVFICPLFYENNKGCDWYGKCKGLRCPLLKKIAKRERVPIYKIGRVVKPVF